MCVCVCVRAVLAPTLGWTCATQETWAIKTLFPYNHVLINGLFAWKAWEKVETTLGDLERCNKSTTTFLKNASSAANEEGEVNNLYDKLQKVQKQAKILEANLKHCRGET